eukprot:6061619-Pyramimonas_sp.AAC.1
MSRLGLVPPASTDGNLLYKNPYLGMGEAPLPREAEVRRRLEEGGEYRPRPTTEPAFEPEGEGEEDEIDAPSAVMEVHSRRLDTDQVRESNKQTRTNRMRGE